MRSANRTVHAVTEAKKEATDTDKLQADQFYLHLQNLMYERNHLRYEIEACKSFRSSHVDIDLISADEFVRSKPEATAVRSEDHHAFMLQRLEDELEERKRLRAEVSWDRDIDASAFTIPADICIAGTRPQAPEKVCD